MRKAVCALILVGFFLFPALPATAKPLDDSSVQIQDAIQGSIWFMEIKGWLDRVNAWFAETLGVDFYYLAGLAADFAISGTRLAIDLAFRALAQIRDFLGY